MGVQVHCRLEEERHRQAFAHVREHLSQVYAVPVEIRSDLAGNTGRLNGMEIDLSRDQGVNVSLAVMGHLFGHTVQWGTSPRWRALGEAAESLERCPSATEILEIRVYEREAWEYALGLFHEAGVRDQDGWLSDYAAADWSYLMDAYERGRPPEDFAAYLRPGAPLLSPRAIPRFVPVRCALRYSF